MNVRAGIVVTASLLCAAAGLASEPDGAGLQPGVVPGAWKTGGPDCVSVPDWQVHEYNEDFYILRESGCTNYEKPFLYLIFGQEKALLEDTGAGRTVQTAPIVTDLMAKWAKKKNHAPVSLVVIHSHGHGDHTAGDKQFQGQPNVQFIAATPEELQKAAGIGAWPTDIGKINLGQRILDVIPIPGHQDASIALYDRVTGNLLTGDSLYPGRLYVPEAAIPTYAASAKRLAGFAMSHPIAHVFGTHIEQSATPYMDYKRGTQYQPEEHALALTRAHVLELNDAFAKMGAKPHDVVLPDFSIVPRIGNVQSEQAGTGLGLVAGTLPAGWKTGGPNCLTVPDWQVHEYNENFYILRESGCIHFEKPFLYLIFGQDKVLLEDTGAGEVQTAPFVMDLIAKWAKKNNRMPPQLVVIHSHGHGDHIAGDKQFQAMPEVQFIAPTPAEISKAAGIATWPTDIGKIDLGGRVLDVIPIPGHNDASITLYDRLTGNLLTGDSLYPGRLSASDFPGSAASAQRLADFVGDHPIAHVLGTHIEQTKTSYLDYPRGSTYQPEEHSLELSRAHVIELNEAFIAIKAHPEKTAMPDTTITVRAAGAGRAAPATAK
ncbi:MAG TPA: MBL fold metallo-hydrolase [Bryobacteraceae bacterium]|jgi:glyoxylase-like metal-dependent hydrolase (beta-lactamase superfamily II)